VAVISLAKGRFTYGESGRLNLAWDMNGVPRGFWLGGPEGRGTPVHPPRQLSETPPAFEFARPIRVTYPLWHDPSYWYEGVRPQFELSGALRPILESRRLYESLARGQALFLAGLLALYAVGDSVSQWVRDVRDGWPLWLPAGVGLAMFTVAGAEGRYVAPFLTLAIVAAMSAAHMPILPGWRRLVAAALLALMAASFGKSIGRITIDPEPVPGRARASIDAARALAEAGLQRGDQVALIRAEGGVYFARVAGVQVIAETPQVDFWFATEQQRRDTLAAFAAAGAQAVVTSAIPEEATSAATDWIRLGDTTWRALLLRP
jgi:hypothetical protein